MYNLKEREIKIFRERGKKKEIVKKDTDIEIERNEVDRYRESGKENYPIKIFEKLYLILL